MGRWYLLRKFTQCIHAQALLDETNTTNSRTPTAPASRLPRSSRSPTSRARPSTRPSPRSSSHDCKAVPLESRSRSRRRLMVEHRAVWLDLVSRSRLDRRTLLASSSSRRRARRSSGRRTRARDLAGCRSSALFLRYLSAWTDKISRDTYG